MACDCCESAARYPQATRKVYDPACIHCGARYIALHPQWRDHVLEVWGKIGHAARKLMDLSRSKAGQFDPNVR